MDLGAPVPQVIPVWVARALRRWVGGRGGVSCCYSACFQPAFAVVVEASLGKCRHLVFVDFLFTIPYLPLVVFDHDLLCWV